MIKHVYWTLAAFITPLLLEATLFQPVGIKEQVHESSGIVYGEVIDVFSRADEQYGVVSTAFIKADYWMGLEPENNHVEVVFPGGEANGKGVRIEGAPKFTSGERVVVFLKQSDGLHWVQNLGLGKFEVKRIGKLEVMVNQIFPKIPSVGQMLLNDFLQMAENIKEEKFKRRIKDKYERGKEAEYSQLIRRRQDEQGPLTRSPASSALTLSSDQSSKQGRGITPAWLAEILGLLGALVRAMAVIKKRKQ